MNKTDSQSSLERYGFGHDRGSAHMARTMMLDELRLLLKAVPAVPGLSDDYSRAIEMENCLGKRSHRTRTLTRRHLTDLYALKPEQALFRTLRYLWQRDAEGQPLIAGLCAYVRDPFMRVTAPLILDLPEGHTFARESIEKLLDTRYPGRFSQATLQSTAGNLASTWTQTGHLMGCMRKSRSKARATAGSTAYALLLGFLTGERGESLFRTEYARLLDCPFETALELAETASRKGWIVLKRVGNVIEVLFPSILTQQEMGWVHEQS